MVGGIDDGSAEPLMRDMASQEDEKMAEGGIARVQDESEREKVVHATTIERAKIATDKEHRMTLWDGIRTYTKAIAWSMIISLCIAMEAFDVCLLNTFCKSRLSPPKYNIGLTNARCSTSIPGQVRRAAARWNETNPSTMASWPIQRDVMWTNHRPDHQLLR